jgi:hypothetical protein
LDFLRDISKWRENDSFKLFKPFKSFKASERHADTVPHEDVVVQFGMIPHSVRDDNGSKYVISSAARNLFHIKYPSHNQTEPSPMKRPCMTLESRLY